MRCAACGATWRATPDPQPEPAVATAVEPEPPEDDPFEAPAPAAEEEALFEQPAPAPVADEEFPRRRAEPEIRRSDAPRRDSRVPGVAWAALGAAIALLLVVALVFRVDIVQLWPKAASAYASIGLPVNGIGLEIEKVHAQPSLLDGRPALVVTGELHNIRRETLVAPPISVSLLDRDGRRVVVKTFMADDRIIPPGQRRDFKISLLNPPSDASNLDVTFVLGKAAIPTAGAASSSPAAPGAGSVVTH